MTRRELRCGRARGGGFIVAVGLLCWMRPPGSFAVPRFGGCVGEWCSHAGSDRYALWFPRSHPACLRAAAVREPAVLVPAAGDGHARARAAAEVFAPGPIGRLLKGAPNSWFAVAPPWLALADTEPGQAGAWLLLAALHSESGGLTASSLPT